MRAADPLTMSLRLPLVFAIAIAAASTWGCSGDDVAADPTGGVDDGLPASCNPLRSEGACLLPFPSAIFLAPDSATETGLRVALKAEQFPTNDKRVAFDPARMNRADGFSPSSEILAYFPERLDPASLPPVSDPAVSLSAESATVIVDMDEGALVAHFAEVDAQILHDEDRQALIMRPMTRLAAGHRFAVAVTKRARTLAQTEPASPPGWEAIADGSATDPGAKAQAARMPAIFEALAGAGVAKSDVLLAWDFVTASQASLTAPLDAMRDQTLEAIGETGLGYAIASVEDNFNQRTLRRIRGTFTVPKFLTQTDPAVAEATLQLDAEGLPLASGTYEAPFTLILPRSAENGPVRLLVFGHGFLGAGEDELGGKSGSHVQEFADAYGYAVIATDWSGLSKYEGIDSAGSGAASLAVQDLNRIPWISDRVQQAVMNVVTLARVARASIAKDPALFVGGAQVIDDSRVDYYGISLGGILGGVALSASPDLARGALNVGGGSWSTLLQRSLNWLLFKLFVDGAYPDKLDQQVLIDVMQASFDSIDPITFAPTILSDNQVLLQMAVRDAQVHNLATAMLARTEGLPLLDDAPLAIFGLPPQKGPLSSAMTAWDTHEDPLPETNVSASVSTQNGAHNGLRGLPSVQMQLDHFLRMGEVISTCEGVCDPE